MHSHAFEEAYARLNIEQKRAVDTIEGPVMVIAGPGTGKTQLLTLRIARILLQTDTQPENILALTFTESGARAMRERLAVYIGPAAYRVAVYTFHEFCGVLLRTFPEAFERIIGGRLITDIEQISLISKILDSEPSLSIRPRGNPSYYVQPLISALSTLKKEYITPDNLRTHIAALEESLRAMPRVHEKGRYAGHVRSDYTKAETKLNRTRELLFVYTIYESSLRSDRLYDFDDMILETIASCERDESFLRTLQETYHYVLADEHQDVNNSQNRILELLCNYHAQPNICVVGDEKQSIYRFQGASLENFLYFENRFGGGSAIALTQNYRSTQQILDFAHSCITAEPSPADNLRIPLSAVTKDHGTLTRRIFPSPDYEHAFLAQEIQSLMSSVNPAPSIAVIVRTNAEVEEIATYLRKKGISVTSTAEYNVLHHPIMRSIEMLLRCVSDPFDAEALYAVLQSPYSGVPIADVMTLMQTNIRDVSVVTRILDPELLTSCSFQAPERVAHMQAWLHEARARMVYLPPPELLEYTLHASGLFDFIMQHTIREGVSYMRRVYDDVREYVHTYPNATLVDVLRGWELRRQHQLPLTTTDTLATPSVVSVMTAHKSKGLEFEYVFIPHLTDAKWGTRSKVSFFSLPILQSQALTAEVHEDDARKLLYVAMTRAQRHLYLSHSSFGLNGKGNTPTRFLVFDGAEHIPYTDTTSFVADYPPEEILEPVSRQGSALVDIVVATLRDRGLSATALNNYMENPWNYIFRNVIRVPELKSESAEFGTLIHSVLCDVYREYRRAGSWPSFDWVRTRLSHFLDRSGFSPTTYARFHTDALALLVPYLERCAQTVAPQTREEFKMTTTLETHVSTFPTLTLTGTFDRLDCTADGTLIRVVDYKTGKPKTRGVIEGTTQDSHGGYKRQLVFYALLLKQNADPLLQSREMVLSFVEPDTHGRIHEETYVITDEEIDALQKEIDAMIENIVSGGFIADDPDPTSPYVSYVAALRERGEI